MSVIFCIRLLYPFVSCEFGSTEYYLKCMIGGALSCGLTHTAVVPLDLVKCRMQVDSAKYPSLGKGMKVNFDKLKKNIFFLIYIR